MEKTDQKPNFEEDANASSFESMSQERLDTLGALTKEARDLDYTIEKMTAALEDSQKKLRELLELKIPEIMQGMNMTEIKLTTGERLIMKKFYAAHISEEHQIQAFEWLRKNGHDAIIKNEVKGSFGKGEDQQVTKVMEILSAQFPGIFNCKTSVHASTLKSFVKEQLESGAAIPTDLLGVHVGNKITIK